MHVGCDVVDAVRFNTKRIEDATIDGRTIHIYRYKRAKTKVTAIVKPSADVAQELRSVPRLAESPDGMPFRNPGVEVNSDRSEWSKRVIALLHAAGVEWVDLPPDDGAVCDARRPTANNSGTLRGCAGSAKGGCQRTWPRCWGTSTPIWPGSYAPWVPDLEQAYLRRIVRMERA